MGYIFRKIRPKLTPENHRLGDAFVSTYGRTRDALTIWS